MTHLGEVLYRLTIACSDLSIIYQHVSAGGPGTPIKVQHKVAQKVQVKEVRGSFLKPTAVNLGGWQSAQEFLSKTATEHRSPQSSRSLECDHDPPNYCISLFMVPSIN